MYGPVSNFVVKLNEKIKKKSRIRAVTERQGRAGRTEKHLAPVKDARTSLPALDPYVQTSVNTCGWGKAKRASFALKVP